MIEFLYEMFVFISIILVIKFINHLHRTYYMNGQVKEDGSIFFNKHFIYELLSILVYIGLMGGVLYYSIHKKNYYLLIAFVPFLFASVKAIFHILKNIKTQITITDQFISVTNPNGEKFDIVPIQIDFDEVEEEEVWYRSRKRKYRIMNIKYGDNKDYLFDFKENNFVDYSMHIQNQSKKTFGEKIQVNDSFKENIGLKEIGVLIAIISVIWVIYFTYKHFY